jgi:hypothetical protein
MTGEQITLAHSTGGSFMAGEGVLEFGIGFYLLQKSRRTLTQLNQDMDYNA